MSMIGNLLMISEQNLQQLLDDPSLIEGYIFVGQDSDQFLDLDKSWHAIHFMLNGHVYEGDLAMVFFGGEEIGEDLGYGAVRYLTPGQVKHVAEVISKINDEAFSRKYDPQTMDQVGIYPDVWEIDGADGLEYVLPYFQDLKVFYQNAVLRNQAVLIYIN